MWHEWWKGAYRSLVKQAQGKKPLDRPRRRWKNTIKKGSYRLGAWTESIWLRVGKKRPVVVNAVMKFRVP
jgi:hypothetical protein